MRRVVVGGEGGREGTGARDAGVVGAGVEEARDSRRHLPNKFWRGDVGSRIHICGGQGASMLLYGCCLAVPLKCWLFMPYKHEMNVFHLEFSNMLCRS